MISCFEQLPNELIINIFDYMKIADLVEIFSNLNSRFKQLFQSYKNINLILYRNQTYDKQISSEQIIRLVIVTLDHIDLTKFSQIRSLKLNLANENHLQQIQADRFPHLTYLSISPTFSSQSTQVIVQQIFSNKFSHLRYADLGQIDTPLSYSQVPSLRSLVLITQNINFISLILQICLQLTHLQIKITGNDQYNEIHSNLVNHPLKQLIFLQARQSTCIWNMKSICLLMPNLKSIHFSLCTRTFLNLAEDLVKSYPFLRKFSCQILEYPNENSSIEQIRKLHACFSSIQCTQRQDQFCFYSTNNRTSLFAFF